MRRHLHYAFASVILFNLVSVRNLVSCSYFRMRSECLLIIFVFVAVSSACGAPVTTPEPVAGPPKERPGPEDTRFDEDDTDTESDEDRLFLHQLAHTSQCKTPQQP